jgi:hypothetical protein
LELDFFLFWGRISFPFYLSHLFILEIARWYYYEFQYKYGVHPENAEAFAFILLFMLILPFSHLAEKYIDRPARLMSGDLYKIMKVKPENLDSNFIESLKLFYIDAKLLAKKYKSLFCILFAEILITSLLSLFVNRKNI